MRPRRIIAGNDATGAPAILSDEPVPRYCEIAAVPSMAHGLVWSTEAARRSSHGEDPAAAALSFLPGPGATRLLIATLPPDSVYMSPDFDPVAAAAESLAAMPGLAECFEPDVPGMHTTPTVDYVILLEGELWLDMGDGRETVVRPGDIVVQNGARHAWRNRTDATATFAAVLIGV